MLLLYTEKGGFTVKEKYYKLDLLEISSQNYTEVEEEEETVFTEMKKENKSIQKYPEYKVGEVYVDKVARNLKFRILHISKQDRAISYYSYQYSFRHNI